MRIDTAQHMRMSQQMRLAPRMIQSMEILQLPLLALEERIEQELEANVALELVEPAEDDAASDVAADDAERAERIESRELVPGDERSFERLSTLESNYGEVLDGEYSDGPATRARDRGERDRKLDAMANTAARRESLTDQLLHQWSFTDVAPDVAAAGRVLIQYVGDDGLLSADLATIIEQNRSVPGVTLSLELLQTALKQVQQRLEPAGVGALTVQECLLLQVEAHDADPDDEHDWTDVRTLIAEHYDDLLQNRLPKIEQKSGMSIERIRAAMELMRKLTLSPGRDLVDDDVPPIIPDVVVEYDDNADEYVAALCDGRLPGLRVSPQFERMAKDRSIEKDTREFVGNNVRRAAWLIDAVNQRKNTLLRVVKVVLTRQREYFDYGPQHLKPLPMTEVADQLGIHVGTVSRAVADKWLQTPRGLVPLRKFFSGGARTDSGEDMSWEAVRATLREIIGQEDKSRPLSDEALAAELKKRGIDIARRTVVKYRSQMSIPSARLRKEH